ncbi:MAG TPA: hypothetical protein VMZ01_03605, partial [Aestuariivirga sp.]|nr:hypothetical protein [Aestuariivirga sp.]
QSRGEAPPQNVDSAEAQRRKRRRGRRGGRNGRERDEAPSRPELQDGVAGLGDQPNFGDQIAEEADQPAASPELGGNGEAHRGSGRGDRGGRNRDRNRGGRRRPQGGEDRPPRRDAEDRPPRRDAEIRAEPVIARNEPPRPAPIEIVIPEAVEEAEPRKWQPPQPTHAPAVTERKTGWWSKR